VAEYGDQDDDGYWNAEHEKKYGTHANPPRLKSTLKILQKLER
jgi:hypothetical protein